MSAKGINFFVLKITKQNTSEHLNTQDSCKHKTKKQRCLNEKLYT